MSYLEHPALSEPYALVVRRIYSTAARSSGVDDVYDHSSGQEMNVANRSSSVVYAGILIDNPAKRSIFVFGECRSEREY